MGRLGALRPRRSLVPTTYPFMHCVSVISMATCTTHAWPGRSSAVLRRRGLFWCDPTGWSAGVAPDPLKTRRPGWAKLSGRSWVAVFAFADDCHTPAARRHGFVVAMTHGIRREWRRCHARRTVNLLAALLTLGALSIAKADQAIAPSRAAVSSPAPDDVRMVAPALEKYTREQLLDGLWRRPGHGPASPVTCCEEEIKPVERPVAHQSLSTPDKPVSFDP
jgi:hypothetical protein